MQNKSKLEELLRTILGTICQVTPAPLIRYVAERYEFQIKIHAKDQGRVVGKGGRVITAIKEIMWYAGLAQMRQTCGVDLLNPDPFEGDLRNPPFHFNPDWSAKPALELLCAVLDTCLPHSKRASCSIVARDDGLAHVGVDMTKFNKDDFANPDFEEALKTVVHAAVMSASGKVNTEVVWK